MRGIEGRWRWLGRPTFLVAVAVLAVNDHVLKGAFPGWWTGKLSDVAGLVVIGVAAAVLLDVPFGLVVAGAAFVALKVVPGAAELTGPLLGGVTRRDPTDLLALVALVPLAVALDRWLDRGPGHRPRRDLLAGLGAAVPVVGALAAVLTCSATSCLPDPTVWRVVGTEDAVFVEIGRSSGDPAWARSDDGGTTWVSSDPPTVVVPDPEIDGPTSACAPDGTCYQLRDNRFIDRVPADGAAVNELSLSDQQWSSFTGECGGWHDGVLSSIALAGGPDGPDGQAVVASLGSQGVEVRQPDGTWRPTAVLKVHPPEPPPSPALKAAMLGVIALAPLIAVAIWLVGRRRWPSWKAGILTVCVGSVVVLVVAGVVSFGRRSATMTDVLVLIGQLVVYVVAITVAQSRPLASVRPDGASALPPPPG